MRVRDLEAGAGASGWTLNGRGVAGLGGLIDVSGPSVILAPPRLNRQLTTGIP